MITMMEHPKHGRHPAIGHEVENMKANGWAVCAPKAAAAAPAATQDVIALANVEAATPVVDTPPASVVAATEAKPAPKRRGPNKAKAK